MVVSTLLHNVVYSNFFLSCWTNDVEDFPKATWVISPPSCHLRFFDCCPRNFFIQEKQNGNVVSTSHWIRPVYKLTPFWRAHFNEFKYSLSVGHRVLRNSFESTTKLHCCFAQSLQFVDLLVTVKMSPDLVLKSIINCFNCMNEKRGSNLIQSIWIHK